jgi:TonB family protein
MRLGWFQGLITCLVLALTPAAHADIKSFNQAVQAGNSSAAAEAAASTWPTLDKARPDAPVIAREFSFVAMMAGRSDVAKPIALWLAEEGATRPDAGVDPRLAAVLYQWSRLGDGARKADRTALLEALETRAAAPEQGDRISVAAASALLADVWEQRDWKGVAKSVDVVLPLAAMIGAEGVSIADRTRMIGYAARFIDDVDSAALVDMAKLYAELAARNPEAVHGKHVTSTDQTRDATYAWIAAMQTYFPPEDSGPGEIQRYTRRLSAQEYAEISAALEAGCDLNCQNVRRVAKGEAPLCSPDLRTIANKLRYPQRALGNLMTGAVYLGIDTDEAGRATDVRLLASVPSETFPEAAMSAMRTLVLERDSNRSLPNCTMAGTRAIMIVYRLEP